MHSGFTMFNCLNCRISAYFWILALAACKSFSRKFRQKSSKIEKMGSRRPRKRREVENRDLSDLVLNSRHFGIWRQKSPKIDKISCRTAVEAFWGLSAEIVVLEAPRQSREPPNNLRTRPTKSGNLRTTAERSRTLPNTFLALRPAGPPGRSGMPGGAPTHPRSKLAEKAPPNSEILKKVVISAIWRQSCSKSGIFAKIVFLAAKSRS